MEETVYLGYKGKATNKWLIIAYLFSLLVFASQAILMILQRRPLALLYAAFLLVFVIAGITLLIYSRRSGVPRVELGEAGVAIKPAFLEKRRSFSSNEIDHLEIHPSRVDLFLKTDPRRAIAMSAFDYGENRRLKSLLKEFAAAHAIPCTETGASATRRETPH
ncbi:MAG TPA: hypothetical protein PLG50_02010 [bacterium]|nr:hypothetical protein [bacterium]HQG44417.1 hypothetical protein [bacterium]HQI47717.1 hypothetical protein [bacterium]HQJ64078.1 hypothetical protein [bacterium]